VPRHAPTPTANSHTLGQVGKKIRFFELKCKVINIKFLSYSDPIGKMEMCANAGFSFKQEPVLGKQREGCRKEKGEKDASRTQGNSDGTTGVEGIGGWPWLRQSSHLPTR